MKIGIVTIQHAKYSYGAILQALATNIICQRYSDEVDIINYENYYEQKGIKSIGSGIINRIKRSLNYYCRMYIYGGYKNPYIDSRNIDAIYPSITARCYTSIQEMNNLDYDILITGSDQVWNPVITGGLDPVYFLNFANPRKKISYASSMGSYILKDAEKTTVRNYLSSYYGVSVRENFAKDQLSVLYDKEIKVVLDPTLLLDKNQWLDYFKIKPQNKVEKYILTFFVTSGIDSYWSDIEQYADYYKLPIWNIQSHNHKSSHVDKVISTPKVDDFLALIENAEVIITNSFHGTAFAINFNKEFVPVLARKNPQRVVNLLEELGLSNRINISEVELNHPIDYDSVNKRLEELRSDSINWLENNIKD